MALALTSCTGSASGHHGKRPGLTTAHNPGQLDGANGPLVWYVAGSALKKLDDPRLAAEVFDHPQDYVVVNHKGSGIPQGWKVRPVESFPSETAIASALDHGLVPKDVVGIGFDDEAWSLTPASERANPTAAVRAASQVVHSHGLAYLQLGNLPVNGSKVGGAKYANVVDIQAQGKERDTARYVAYVKALAAQARQFNPHVIVLAGISTNPSGPPVTATELFDAVQATHEVVDGYWFNLPSPGKACPRCNPANIEVATQFLQMMVNASANGQGGKVQSASGTSTSGSLRSGELLAYGGQPASWIFAESHFDQVVGAPGVARLMEGGEVFEPMSTKQRPSSLLPVLPTAVFHSYQDLLGLANSGGLPGPYKAILYDNERFADTPSNEQADPHHYDTLVAQLAKRYGLTSICDFIQPDRLPSSERDPAQEVPPCDVIGLNTVQQSERNPAQYKAIVAKETSTIRSMSPSVPVLAGLSSNPAGGAVTASELAQDIEATRAIVNGWWLNVPAPGVGCPDCGKPQPQIMADALEMVAKGNLGD
jgi:hypothetical protein